MDDARPRRERGGLAGDAIVEAPADVEQHVALLDGAVHVDPAVHAGHAERERMILGEGAEAVQRGDHRHVRVRRRAAVARRARRTWITPLPAMISGRCALASSARRLRDAARLPCRSAACSRAGPSPASQCGTMRACCASLVTSMSTGPGRPVLARWNASRKTRGNVGGIGDEVVVLGDRHGDAGDVGLLEGVRAEQRARHLPGDGHHRRAVHQRVGDGRDQVGGARAASPDAHAHAPARARVALGGVPGALLVTAEHVAQASRYSHMRVVERHDRPAGDAEHHVDTLADQRLAHDLRAGACAGSIVGCSRRLRSCEDRSGAGVGHQLACSAPASRAGIAAPGPCSRRARRRQLRVGDVDGEATRRCRSIRTMSPSREQSDRAALGRLGGDVADAEPARAAARSARR